jgi:hypothetical protein
MYFIPRQNYIAANNLSTGIVKDVIPLPTDSDGVPLAAGVVGSNAQIRNIVAGSNIVITDTATGVEISSGAGTTTVESASNTEADAAGIRGLFQTLAGTDLVFKSLRAGTNVTLADGANDTITINSTATSGTTNTGVNLAGADTATQKAIFKEIVSDEFRFKSIVAGSNVNFTSDDGTKFTINATTGAGGGDISAAANLTDSLVGEVGLFESKVVDTLNFRSLVAGNNMTLTQSVSGNTIEIGTTSADLVTGGANLGGGQDLFVDLDSGNLRFNTLSAGDGIGLAFATNLITLSADLSSIINLTGTTGIGVLKQVNAGEIQLKKLRQGANITLTDDVGNDEIEIAATQATTTNLIEAPPLGTEIGIYKEQVGGEIRLKSLVPGSNITITENPSGDTIVIGTSGSTVVDGANVGGETGIFDTNNTGTLEFNTLKAGTGIAFDTGTANVIQIDNDATAKNLGSGVGDVPTGVEQGIFFQKTSASEFEFKSIAPGTNMTMNSTANVITINTTAHPNDGNQLATGGVNVYKDVTSDKLNFRNIVSANPIITLVQDATTITLDTTAEINAGDSVGGGVDIYTGKTGDNLQFRTLVAGTNITLDDGGGLADTVTINCTVPSGITGAANTGPSGVGVFDNLAAGVLNFKKLESADGKLTIANSGSSPETLLFTSTTDANAGANLGAGPDAAVFSGVNGTTKELEFRRIKAGDNITVTQNTNDITISAFEILDVRTLTPTPVTAAVLAGGTNTLIGGKVMKCKAAAALDAGRVVSFAADTSGVIRVNYVALGSEVAASSIPVGVTLTNAAGAGSDVDVAISGICTVLVGTLASPTPSTTVNRGQIIRVVASGKCIASNTTSGVESDSPVIGISLTYATGLTADVSTILVKVSPDFEFF